MTAHDQLANASQKAKLTARDFFLLGESGAFDNYRKTELLDGDVYFMNAQYRQHARIKIDLHNSLHAALSASNSDFCSMTEVTIALGQHDAPEPDIVLTSQPFGDGPVPAESVALVIEIADTTLKTDMGVKAQIYAKGGIPEYWIADVQNQRVVQLWALSADGYTQQRHLAFGEAIESTSIAGLRIVTPTARN